MSITPEQVEQIKGSNSPKSMAQDGPTSASDPSTPDRFLRPRPSPFHRDAGLFSYTAGVLGAVAFMALAIGPGWLGFLIAFLPASLFASWAVSGHV